MEEKSFFNIVDINKEDSLQIHELKDKNILITNYSIEKYTGSEINCLEISKELINMGCNIEVATINKGMPLLNEFNKLGVKVKNILNENLSLAKYDIILAHHYIVLDLLIFKKNITAEVIIYNSLSPFEHLERPPLYINDLSLCLCNSKETKNKLIKDGVEENHIKIFPNYAREEFFTFKRNNQNNKLKNICVVSNHVASEILELKSILEKDKINVDIYGFGYKQALITTDIISKYDLVITIGKTVQYSMAMMTPVYCYDIHGGPGWINDKNINLAFENNFSGRGFNKRTSYELYHDIIYNYEINLKKLNELKDFALKNCNLNSNILNIVRNSNIKNINIEKIREKYRNCENINMSIIKQYTARK